MSSAPARPPGQVGGGASSVEQNGCARASVRIGIATFGPDGVLTFSNQRFAELLSAGAGAVEAGMNFAALIERLARAPGFDTPAGAAFLHAQSGHARQVSAVLRRDDAAGQVVEIASEPLPGGGWTMTVADITKLARAEDEARTHAEHMETMLASIRHGILYWGPDKRLIASNAIAADLLGHPPDLLKPGRSEDEILDHMLARGEWGEADTARIVENLRNRDRSVPYRRCLKTGSGRTLEARSEPVPGGGWISTFTEVTDQVKGQQELRAAKDAAEAANQAKSRFLATMSHELRTPLNAVIGFSDALLREGRQPAPGRVSEFAQQINDAGRQLLGLINIILDVARIEAGRFDLAVDRVDIGTLIRDAIRNADAAAQAAEITLVAELPEELPILRADERRLQQVLGHLLSNAVKFTDAGGTVTVGALVEPDGGLLIYVRDTGIGIPEEALERVFEPFTQLDNTLSRRFQGAGIGLYVARALVMGHGGHLQLRSNPGNGTIAEVRLPPEHLI